MKKATMRSSSHAVFTTTCRTPARASASGYISSLFTYTNTGTPREWEEIDIELEGGRPDKFQANLIYGLDAASWTQTRDWGAWETSEMKKPPRVSPQRPNHACWRKTQP